MNPNFRGIDILYMGMIGPTLPVLFEVKGLNGQA